MFNTLTQGAKHLVRLRLVEIRVKIKRKERQLSKKLKDRGVVRDLKRNL